MNLHASLATFPFVTYLDDVQLSDQLQADQIKGALIVACGDMGATLPYVCTDPEVNLLIFQGPGHRSSQTGIGSLLARGTIDHLVIYGHTNCQFTRLLVESGRPAQSLCNQTANLFRMESQSALRQYSRNLTQSERANWRRLNEWFVLRELRSALLYPGVAERAYRSQLKLHGWLYVSETKELEVFAPATRQFVRALAQKQSGSCQEIDLDWRSNNPSSFQQRQNN